MLSGGINSQHTPSKLCRNFAVKSLRNNNPNRGICVETFRIGVSGFKLRFQQNPGEI